MAKSLDLEATLKQARVLLDQRIAVVEQHKRNVDAEQTAREALSAREQKTAQTWAALLAAGWSVSELTGMGFKEPAVKAPKRAPRGRRAADASVAALPAQGTPDAQESRQTAGTA
ncbi:hypothetical protein ACWC9H_27170 [Streptomyces sp. NPDC001251]